MKPLAVIPKPVQRMVASIFGRGVGFGGRRGGPLQTSLGMGGASDKTAGVVWSPTNFYIREVLEVLYRESWGVKKFIDIPVDDMFWHSREFAEDANKRAVEAIKDFEFIEAIAQAIKAARLYGSGLMVLVCTDDDQMKPLRPERVRQGDFKNIIVADRYNATIMDKGRDPEDRETFGKPTSYQIHTDYGGTFMVHPSRVIRFDGLTPLTNRQSAVYDGDWGTSELTPILRQINQDEAVNAAVSQLVTEASYDVLKVDDLEERMKGRGGESIEDLVAALNMNKSVFRMILMDSGSEIDRKPANFSNLDKVMNEIRLRLAAAADIPATRFWGQAPLGLNSTGEGDLHNYALRVEALRAKTITPVLKKLDTLVLRSAGIRSEPPEYKWPSLIDLSEEAQANARKIGAEATRTMTEAIGGLVAKRIIDEDEARELLEMADPELFGDLGPLPEDWLEPPAPPALPPGQQPTQLPAPAPEEEP